MSVWLTIPSARPPEEAEKCLKLWRERGYKIALLVDWNPPGCPLYSRTARGDLMICGGGKYAPKYSEPVAAGMLGLRAPLNGETRKYFPHFDQYPGYAQSVNALIVEVLKEDPSAEWFIAAGDDTEPDPNKSAEEIARECEHHFSLEYALRSGTPHDIVRDWTHKAFGVMQPTGDRWQEGMGGFTNAPIDRVCGSAWYGREYCRRMYQGAGPLFSGYKHMFVDQEAQEVALKIGVLWQRRDLTQKHNHVLRGATDKELVDGSQLAIRAPHLVKWNTQEHWNESKALFESRKAAGIPGHEPL